MHAAEHVKAPQQWGDVFRDPDMVGQSEYRALHDLMKDVAELGSFFCDPNPEDEITESRRLAMLSSLSEVETWCSEIRKRLNRE